MKSKNLLGLDESELMAFAERLGAKPFRGRQLYQQIYKRREFDFALMTDLALPFRVQLAKNAAIELPAVQQRMDSADGTVKFLLRLADGNHIESVFIPEEKRNTLCISSQVGCGVGCTFCLTAQMGFRRNLTPGEIVGQVLHATRTGCLDRSGFNIVFMGMGEPLYNFQNVMRAFSLLIDPRGMAISARKITVSTSGVVPVLRKFNHYDKFPNLAVSLNATTERARSRIMPINDKWSLDELLQACRELAAGLRRRITFEYVLLRGETDSDDDARRLSRMLEGIPSKVNLIAYNENRGLPHRRPTDDRVARFQALLAEHGVAAFVRKTRGTDISAACGQLAHIEHTDSTHPVNSVAV